MLVCNYHYKDELFQLQIPLQTYNRCVTRNAGMTLSAFSSPCLPQLPCFPQLCFCTGTSGVLRTPEQDSAGRDDLGQNQSNAPQKQDFNNEPA